MPINSRAKGKRIELVASKAISSIFGVPIRRTAQVDGGLSADLVGLPGAHIEVKGRKRIAAIDFLRQAERDANNKSVPFVVMLENGDTKPVLMLRLADLGGLVQCYADSHGVPIYPTQADGA